MITCINNDRGCDRRRGEIEDTVCLPGRGETGRAGRDSVCRALSLKPHGRMWSKQIFGQHQPRRGQGHLSPRPLLGGLAPDNPCSLTGSHLSSWRKLILHRLGRRDALVDTRATFLPRWHTFTRRGSEHSVVFTNLGPF